jgi:hypothetical protein
MTILISPAQALLMLMEQPCSPEEHDALMRMYIRGISMEEYSRSLAEKCATKLSQYSISFLPEVINEDPVRRYFESYFALYTLKNKLPQLATTDLRTYLQNIHAQLTATQKAIFSPLLGVDRATILKVLTKTSCIEQVDILEVLESDHFTDKTISFSSDEKEKIWLVVLSMALIWQLVDNDPLITHHIYSVGFIVSEVEEE